MKYLFSHFLFGDSENEEDVLSYSPSGTYTKVIAIVSEKSFTLSSVCCVGTCCALDVKIICIFNPYYANPTLT